MRNAEATVPSGNLFYSQENCRMEILDAVIQASLSTNVCAISNNEVEKERKKKLLLCVTTVKKEPNHLQQFFPSFAPSPSFSSFPPFPLILPTPNQSCVIRQLHQLY